MNRKCQRCKEPFILKTEHMVKFDCDEHYLCPTCYETFQKWFKRLQKGGHETGQRTNAA